MEFTEDPKDKGVSMKKSLEILESQGFKEVKLYYVHSKSNLSLSKSHDHRIIFGNRGF